jgi:hypothetical protein
MPQRLPSRRREHCLGRLALGDQRGQPSQRRLGAGELAQFLLGLGVGDRRRGQLGEVRHPHLGAGREVRPRGRGHCHAPVASLHHDGHGHRGPQAQPADHVAKRAGTQHVAGDPGRAARPERGRHRHPRLQLPAKADRCLITYPAIGPYDGGIALNLAALPGQSIKAGDERRLSADQAAELIGDRAEHLGRLGAAGH